jgi:hypothetical protein
MIVVQPSSLRSQELSFVEERGQPENSTNLATGSSSDPSPIQPSLSAEKSQPIVNQDAKKLSERPTSSQSKAPDTSSSSLSPRSIRRGNSFGLTIVIPKSHKPPEPTSQLLPAKRVEPKSHSARPAPEEPKEPT